MMSNGVIPEQAVNLAKIFCLEICESNHHKDIEVVSEPRQKHLTYNQFYTSGMIWALDVVDEFQSLDSQSFLTLNNQVCKPKISERHVLKFRPRISNRGLVHVSVNVDGHLYCEFEIEENNEC